MLETNHAIIVWMAQLIIEGKFEPEECVDDHIIIQVEIWLKKNSEKGRKKLQMKRCIIISL